MKMLRPFNDCALYNPELPIVLENTADKSKSPTLSNLLNMKFYLN